MDPITLAFAAAKFIPDIVGWIAGDDAEDKAKKVVGVVENITGLTGQAAVDALSDNPDYQVKAREMILEEMRIHAKDRDSARTLQASLAKAGHASAYAPAILSIIVTSGFFIIIYVVLRVAIPPASEKLVYMLLGTLGAGFTQVLNFWLGSSRSSQQKTTMLAK